MNRNTNLTFFNLMVLEMAIIAELLNNLVVVVVDETETPNLDGYDDYDFPHPEQETLLDRAIVDEQTYDEMELTDWLKNDCGLEINKSASDYAPNTKMIALSVDEMQKIRREFLTYKVRAEEGEELARKIQSIHDEFFPQA